MDVKVRKVDKEKLEDKGHLEDDEDDEEEKE